MATAAELHELYAARSTPTLDDQTWSDLDLDDVFDAVRHGTSVVGALALLSWLRSPVAQGADVALVRARASVGAAVEAAGPLWAGVAERLDKLPWLPLLLITVLWGTQRLRTLGRTPTILAALAAMTPLGFVVSTQVGVGLLVGAFVLNMGFHFWASRTLEAALASLAFVSALLDAGQAAARLPMAAELTTVMTRLRPLARAIAEASVPPVLDDFPAEHLRILFLTRERRLTRSVELIDAHRADLCLLFDTVGALEASRAAHRFQATLGQTCVPVFEGDALALTAATHPTLNHAVGNDLRLSTGMVITGSNMAGKSTFLRTVGLNVVFAQSLGFAVAAQYRGPVVALGTSLRTRDRLAEGQSTYSAEALRLRDLLLRRGATRALVLIDEPFRGTNSVERIAAGIAVLRHLAAQGALVIAATHDVELPRALAPTFEAGFFVDTVDADGLRFDYRLHHGLEAPRNAIKLLAVLGFPQAVVDEAARLAGRLEV